MNEDQSTRLAVALARETAQSTTGRLCTACVEVLGVTGMGAGITIMGGDQSGPICVSGPEVAALEDVQFTVGQGPRRDAFSTGVSVHAPSTRRVAGRRSSLLRATPGSAPRLHIH